MADESVNGQGDEGKPEATPAPEPKGIDRKAVEEHPAFRNLAKQKAALEAKLAEQAAAEKAREEQRLQEQGEYKTLAEQRAAELAAMKAAHENQILAMRAESALQDAGFTHPVLRSGYVAQYLSMPQAERLSLAEWAAKLKDDPANVAILTPPSPAVGGGPNGGAAPRAGNGASSVNKMDMFSKDPAKRNAAWNAAIEAEQKKLGRQ